MTNFNVNNRDIICYLVVKHSWKGKYKRIFSIGTLAITTYNPQTLEITNQWQYEDFLSIKPCPPKGNGEGKDEFMIHFRSKGKKDNMRFSSEYSSDILTDVLLNHTKFAHHSAPLYSSAANKYGWDDRPKSVTLRVAPAVLEQIDGRGTVVAKYPYKAIRNISKISDCQGGFVIDVGPHRRRHIFISREVDEVIVRIRETAAEWIGISIPYGKETITLDDVRITRFGLCSRDESQTSYMEHAVQKFSIRHEQPIRRLLCLSETAIIERDPHTYFPICVTPLKQIVCIVRLLKDPQQFIIEYESGEARAYAAPDRDLIIASLVDGTRASGNSQVYVTGHRFDRSLRLVPYTITLDEDSESQCMRHVIAPTPGLKRSELIRRFNANIPYNGLVHSTPQETFFTENKGKVIIACLEAVLGECYAKDEPTAVHKCESQLQCLRRLFASKSGFHAFTEVNGVREKLGLLVARVLQWKQETIDHATVEMLCALMHPMHSQYVLRTEQLNKQSLLSSPAFVEHLLDLLVHHVERGSGWLVIASLIDFLTYAVCAPYSETTSGETFDLILKLVAARGRSFYNLFQSSSMTIVKGAGMVLRSIIEESDVETSKSMQNLALTQGAFLSHIQLALLATGRDLRVLTNKQLSGHLLGLWLADNEPAHQLLRRCLPRGLLDFLQSEAKVPVAERDLLIQRNNLEDANNETRQNTVKDKLEQFKVSAEAGLERFIMHWDLEKKLNFHLPRKEEEKANARPVVLRKRRERVKTRVNWRLFAYEFARDHAKANLIWNEKTREEFRVAIENELRALASEKEQTATKVPISWNHTEFQVAYPSLQDEIKIGDYYLRLLLQENEENSTPIADPCDFFNTVYHRFLLPSRVEMRCFCLSAMAIAYERHHMTIGHIPDTKYFVTLLAKCTLPAERDRLVQLISKLALNRENAREMILCGVVTQLVDLSVLAHLHVQRATIQNQTNVIEASAGQMTKQSEEWYYNDKDSTRQGPFTFEKMKELYTEKAIFEKTAIWASGMDQWQSLSAVPQFRWTVCCHQEQEDSTAGALYNLTQLATVCLDVLVQLCSFFPSRDENESIVRPMPRIKKQLSEPTTLYQVVQLLLTYDPYIVQRVATLIHMVMQDNPFLPRLYLSGLFFFILMYNGSNVLPIAKLLHYTHLQQAFRSANPRTESHSVLSPLLPEAAIYYLEEYGPEKYAQVYLGEFDNPEIIWNNAMRRHLIERVAVHVSDFSFRLTSNVKALYQYCPIPIIDYPELTNELFCHVYYLRHLCDEQRFPEWPIREPIQFLRACLATWHEEIDKKAPKMSVEQAASVLGLADEATWRDASAVRRAYFKLASKYHPDKNPEGREMFEKINAAYELLSSDIGRGGIPDAQRIVLCLRAQSIIYSRHSQELSAYKYAGYTQLIKTIDLEAKDDALFQEGGGALLAASIELANYTLMSSALNAEQLRREQGLEALQLAFDRCVPMVTASSKPTDMPVQVCEHICNCLATSARFDACRQRIAEMPTVFGNLCRLLQFTSLTRLGCAVAACLSSFSVCTLLQTQLFQAGVLWQLIPLLFQFDYTLDEGGVSHEESTNKQTLANKLARFSLEALASLAGFREDKPANDGVQNSLRALLTPYVCKCMQSMDNDQVLKMLNSNTENPYLIWDNATRAELLEFVERHRSSTEQTSELFGAEFMLSVYAKELIIGEIFVRIYNEQPQFVLTDPKSTCMDLLEYVGNEAGELAGGRPPTRDIDWTNLSGAHLPFEQRTLAALTAIANICNHNTGVEMLMIGHFTTVLAYLRAKLHPQLQSAALQVVSIVATNRECVQDLALNQPCSTLFAFLIGNEKAVEPTLRILIALSSNGQIVKEMLEYGGLLCILNVLCQSSYPLAIRLLCADLLAKLQSDKLTGPRWSRFLYKFLPPVFSDAFRDSPNTSITMFDSTSENPELIWNENTRKFVKESIEKAAQELHERQQKDPTAKWKSEEIAECLYAGDAQGELVVGGVYIRLFIKNPSWSVRHPKQFATELLERILELMRKPSPELPLITTAFVHLIDNHTHTADQLPTQGYLPQFCAAMKPTDPEVAKAAIRILRQLSENTLCAEALAKVSCLDGLKACMKKEPTMIGDAAHALKCIMKKNTGELAGQLLSTGMVDFLLDVLAGKINGMGEGMSAARAEIVDALKQATLDIDHGERITAVLEKSPIWAQYKDQRHDLFLPAARMAAIGGGPANNVAGYLTEGMFNPPPLANQPPPI